MRYAFLSLTKFCYIMGYINSIDRLHGYAIEFKYITDYWRKSDTLSFVSGSNWRKCVFTCVTHFSVEQNFNILCNVCGI